MDFKVDLWARFSPTTTLTFYFPVIRTTFHKTQCTTDEWTHAIDECVPIQYFNIINVQGHRVCHQEGRSGFIIEPIHQELMLVEKEMIEVGLNLVENPKKLGE